MRLLLICIFFSSSLFTGFLPAQIEQSKRVEINLLGSEKGFRVIPIAEHGVLLFREIYIRDQYLLDIQLFDADLQKT
jgi:hypothetical protein